MLLAPAFVDQPYASNKIGIRDRLKAATSAAHHVLDEQLSGLDLTVTTHYRRFLQASAAALLPLEVALEQAGVADMMEDWPLRARSPAIMSDLRRLGSIAVPLPLPEQPLDRCGVLGTLYVLEGSRLGAVYLVRIVASRRGFGTTIIERSVPFDLKGDAEIRFDLLGVQARFVIPANFVQMVPSIAGAPSRFATKQEEAPRLSGTALIVEDNLIIAMGAEVILLELGARHVETAASVAQAFKSIERTAPTFALLDVNLGSENSMPVGHKLSELGIPYVFATGYGERAPIPAELSAAPVIQKPYTREVVEAALTKLK